MANDGLDAVAAVRPHHNMHVSLLQKLACALVPMIALSACEPSGFRDPDERFVRMTEEYAEDVQVLGLPDLEMAYVDTLAAELEGPPVDIQRQFFNSYERRSASIDPGALSDCNRVFLEVFRYEIASNLWRIDLVERHRREAAGRAIDNTGIYHQPLGRDWYLYLLDRWLNIDMGPEEILAFGERQLDNALERYRRVQRDLGYEGSDEDFGAYLASSRFRYDAGETPLPLLLANQQTVWENMDRLFADYAVLPAAIRQSGLGDAFPVDAFYVDEEEVFYFNLLEEGFRVREMDLIFLHEATPGHHFQNVHKNEVAECNTILPSVYYHGYTEGWGTYAETLGRELGLYTDLTSYLGWIEWDLVRSIRVVLDVRINHYDWTFEQALEYWYRVMPGDKDIAAREIRRVTDWPAQAITYKIGAHVFLEGRENLQREQGSEFDVRAFHDRALRYGALPLGVLKSVLGPE